MKNLEELQKVFSTRLRQDESMSKHTTSKVGGNAESYLDVDKIDDLVKAVQICSANKIPYFILGGGSNIFVSEDGFKGLVIKNNCRNFEIMRLSGKMKKNDKGWEIDRGETLLYVESGVIMNQLVRFAIENGLSGLEYQLGLPGTVGGAIFMNSNFPRKEAYVGDCLYQAKILTKEGEVKDVDRNFFHFGYDKSMLQQTGDILLSAVFKLTPQKKEILWERGMEALDYRNKTQPKGLSWGCTFRNISITDAINIPTPNRITSVGYLIDKAGLKGKSIGGATISNDHGNFIINTNNATSSDMKALIDLIKENVFKKFGVKLELEVRTIGF